MKKIKTYDFVNAQEMQKKYPATFEAPTKKELDGIKPEDFVKICHNDERFWVIVKKINKDRIIGEVNNDLIRNQPFKLGDKIAFLKNHVYCVMKKGNSDTL